MRYIILTVMYFMWFYSPVQALIYHGVAVPPAGSDAWVVTIETTLVYYTADFGLTWDKVNIPTIRDFFDVFFLTTDSGWTCGRSGDIWRTTDRGSTWERKNLGGPKHAARIRFIDGDFGWAAGGDIVQLRTTDGGAEWQQVFLPIPPFPAGDTAEFQGVWFVDHNLGFLVAGHWPTGDTFLGGQGYIARTTNGGDSWEVVHRDTTYDFYDVFFSDGNTGWVVGGDDRNFRAVVLHTTDGGNSWIEQSLPGEARFLRSLKFTSATEGWACGRYGTIIHTSDGGNNWIIQNSNAESTLFDIDFADSLRGMAAGNGIVLVTTDGGQHWYPRLIGIQEGEAHHLKPVVNAAIRRGRLILPAMLNDRNSKFALLDVSGRRMLDLYPDVNDISQLSPGIYFVHNGSILTKVLLVR
ncbi:MAG: YCF48-related protein [bacterium]